MIKPIKKVPPPINNNKKIFFSSHDQSFLVKIKLQIHLNKITHFLHFFKWL